MKRIITPLALAVSVVNIARADFNPIALTPSSFNADIIVEKTAPPSLNTFVTATIDGGTNNNNSTLFENGYAGTWPLSGLPAPNTTFAALSDANHQFVTPPDYTTKNALLIGNYAGYTTGTLTLTTPTALSGLSVLGTASGGPVVINYTVHHSGGGVETGSINVVDWFANNSTIAWLASARVSMENGGINSLVYTNAAVTANPHLSYADISLSDTVNAVTSIDFAYVSGGRAGIFGLSGTTDNVAFNPLAITGFSHDMIIEAGAPKTGFSQGANVAMDNGSLANSGYGWYEQGFNRAAPTTGIPTNGASISASIAGTNRTFTMPSSYAVNNVFLLANSPGYTTATITLSSPASYAALSLLNSSGNGPVTVNVTVHHASDPDEVFSITSLDWFNGATGDWNANGRFRKEDLTFNNVNGTTPKLFHNDLPLTGASAVTSVDVSWGSSANSGRTMIFALSGAGNPAGPYNPIAISGFNADGVVENTQTLVPLYNTPFPLTTVTTASMDGGTNNTGNTWFENGYYTNTASPGLPAPGATFNSQAQADHHYQMPASYTANNAAFISTNVTSINLTPATPAAYSALSFLNACANGSVTNIVIIEHDDGTAETNQFIGGDWFNTAIPFAYATRGRTDLGRRTINNDPGRTGTANPRLFEAQFFLSNFSSPITNILVQYANPTNSTGRIAIMAVSAATGAVAPILGGNPVSPPTFIEYTNVTLSVGTVQGTLPITNQWQYSTDGGTTWNNINNGGQYSGATSPALTITAAGVTNNGQYRLVAVNVVGTNISGTATITALSGYQDIPLPGDPVFPVGAFTQNPPEGFVAAIDNNTQKYLNFGGNNGTPFLGPIGFVVHPSRGASIVKAIRLYVANDATERDPFDYTLEGSNDGGVTWTLVSTNPLAPPTGRNAGGVPITNTSPLTIFNQEVVFYGNNASYYSYRVSVNNVRNNATANSCQMAEFDLLGTLVVAPPVIVRHPISSVTNYVGGRPTFGITVLGSQLSYQWALSTDGGTVFNPISGATNSAYTAPSVALINNGNQYRCTVTNSAGTAISSAGAVTVIAAPTSTYESAILVDSPIAYWPLNETPDDGSGNPGRIVVDYMGAHNGTYTNVLLAQTGFNPTTEPDTAVAFGPLASAVANSYAGNMQDLSLAAPTNTSTATFSVEAWVLNNPNTLQISDAGIVAKGTGGGGEQFIIDTGGANPARFWRFLVRNGAGGVHAVTATSGSTNVIGPFPNSGFPAWHHVVGVFDAPHSNLVIYVDGIRSGITVAQLTNGVLASSAPVNIGARQGGNGPFNNQFNGTIQDVAIYNTALNSNQVLNHYFAAQPLPIFSVNPTNVTTPEGSSPVLISSAYGPPPLTYQWYESIDAGATYAAMANRTNANLAFTNVPVSFNGYQYYAVATGPYGSTTSSVAVLSVVSGPPQVLVDAPAAVLVYAGRTATISAQFTGTSPFTYGWTSNGVPINDGGRLSGAHTNTLSIVNTRPGDSAVYQLYASNTFGATPASGSTLYVESTPDFNTNGLGWSVNGGASFANNTANMTDAVNGQTRSVWYNYPLYIGGFFASFTYQDVGGGGADGFAFVLHNDPRGTTALGGGGGALGLSGITPSVAATFNIYTGSPGGVGMSFGLNGGNGNPYTSTAPVAIDNTDPIKITVTYDGTRVRVNLTDSFASTSFTTNLNLSPFTLPQLLGADSAYVGFTAATGGVNAQQTIKDFYFIPIPPLSVVQTTPGTFVLSWPASVGGFRLQSNNAVNSPGTWVDVSAPVVLVGNQNQVTVTPGSGVQFYRLVMFTNGPL